MTQALASTYPFKLDPLPYAHDALEPIIDTETMKLHHGKHHKAYVDKLNEALKDAPDLHDKTLQELLADLDAVPEKVRTAVRNHGGGHLNHATFWDVLGRDEGSEPKGELARAIKECFGDVTQFKTAFKESALKHFGSGWTVLAAKPDGALAIINMPNQDSVISQGQSVVLLCDLWEHAFYLKHKNKKPDWIDAFWTAVAWDRLNKAF